MGLSDPHLTLNGNRQPDEIRKKRTRVHDEINAKRYWSAVQWQRSTPYKYDILTSIFNDRQSFFFLIRSLPACLSLLLSSSSYARLHSCYGHHTHVHIHSSLYIQTGASLNKSLIINDFLSLVLFFHIFEVTFTYKRNSKPARLSLLSHSKIIVTS